MSEPTAFGPNAARSSGRTPEDGRPTSAFGSRRRRLGFSVALGAMLLAFTAVWAIPNVAGAAFVDVRAIVAPHPAAGGQSVTIGSDAPVNADSLSVSVEVTNRYPLTVVLSAGQTAFQATGYRRDASGKLVQVWRAVADDPALEEGSDSPVGGGQDAAAVAPGSTRHVVADGSNAFRLADAFGSPLPAGLYYVRVWAYGIASPLVPIYLAPSAA